MGLGRAEQRHALPDSIGKHVPVLVLGCTPLAALTLPADSRSRNVSRVPAYPRYAQQIHPRAGRPGLPCGRKVQEEMLLAFEPAVLVDPIFEPAEMFSIGRLHGLLDLGVSAMPSVIATTHQDYTMMRSTVRRSWRTTLGTSTAKPTRGVAKNIGFFCLDCRREQLLRRSVSNACLVR